MSLLGMEFDIKGHYFKPFYLLLGVFFFIGLLFFLGIIYVYYYTKATLIEWINELKRDRDKWINRK